ncbi:MAG TPA: YggS family pyridoxal phosphate enzyme [Solirubrobacteraceae bacterium]|nr:YggS family pyridoxal phosphate enzyme [Solirubrobacteraceae bacterium]
MAPPPLVTGLTVERVRANLREVQEEIAAAARVSCRTPDDVELLAAVKYVALEELGTLVEAGITLFGENRAQELERKHAEHPDVTWDFIGQLQSRKVKAIAPLVRRIHSVASDSALDQLAKHGHGALEIYVEVNVAEEEGKAGIAPGDLAAFIDRAGGGGLHPTGLMTMPPRAETAEDSRRWFAAARELAHAHDLHGLSMGTTQDFAVAVEEGATCVRVGSRLFR